MKPIVLSFNIAGERLEALKGAAAPLNVGVQAVPPADFARPLRDLLEKGSGNAPAAVLLPFTDEMLVIADMPQIVFDMFLDALRRTVRPPVALKAVMTDTNALWSAVRLRDELKKEHEALMGMKKPRG